MFQHVPGNSICIKKQNSNEILNIFDIIIEKVLCSNTKINNNSKFLLLETMVSNSGCNKRSLEIIFQKLRHLFSNQNELYKSNDNSLLIFNSINTLKSIFAIESKNNFPKNYLYFNASNGLRIFKKKASEEEEEKKIIITNGFSFILWFKLDTELMRESEKESNLIKVKIADSNSNCNSDISISLLIKKERLLLKTNEELINTPIHEFSSAWNLMFFSFKNFKTANTEKIIINYIINSNNHINQIFIDEKNLRNAEIKEINLFENIIGYSTSFIFLNSAVTEKNILNFRDFCKDNFPYGIYSEGKLQKLLNKSSNKILSFYQKEKSKKKNIGSFQNTKDNFNFNDLTYSEIDIINENREKKFIDNKACKVKSNKVLQKLRSRENIKACFTGKCSLKSNISKQHKNSLKEIIDKTEIFIVPFRSRIIKIKSEDSEETDIVNLDYKEPQSTVLLNIKRKCDFEFFNTESSKNSNIYKIKKHYPNINRGISFYSSMQSNLGLLDTQGINNLLPILDLVKNETHENNIIDNKENLLYFMKLIYMIVYDREKNMKNITEKNFFKNASFYFETYDKSLFGSELADVFIDIFKHLFLYNSKNQSYLSFMENFIANEKILLKFEVSKQMEIWEIVYNYINESNELLKFFEIEKLMLIVTFSLFNFFII